MARSRRWRFTLHLTRLSHKSATPAVAARSVFPALVMGLASRDMRSIRTALTLLLAAPAVLWAQRDLLPPGLVGLRGWAAADFVVDVSPRLQRDVDSRRFDLRESELGASGTLGAFTAVALLRADASSDLRLAEAHLTARLPFAMSIRGGRFPLPFGSMAERHRHSLPTIEEPHAHRLFVGPLGSTAGGVSLGRTFRAHGDLTLSVTDLIRTDDMDRTALDPPNQHFAGLGYSARVRGTTRIGPAAVRASLSGLTGRRAQPLSDPVRYQGRLIDAVIARQSVVGLEVEARGAPAAASNPGEETRWGALAQLLWQQNESEAVLLSRIPRNAATGGPFYAGPIRDGWGGSLTLRTPLSRALSIAIRGDVVEETFDAEGRMTAGSAHLEWHGVGPVRFGASYERLARGDADARDRLFLRARFALGESAMWPF